MILNLSIRTFTFFLFLVFLSCSNQKIENKLDSKTFHFDNGRQVVDTLDQLLQKLSDIDLDDSSSHASISRINKDIKQAIENVKTPGILAEIRTLYRYKKHDFTFAFSDDEKIGVFSWDTRMGGSMIDYKNIVLFTLNKKVVPKLLSGNPINYNEIYILRTERNHPIYIFHGWGKTSTTDYYYRIDAYTFRNENLEETHVFPNDQKSMVSSYNLAELSFESQMDFNIEKDGSLILIPEIWGSTVVYRPLTFDGKKYLQQYTRGETNSDYNLQEKDFDISNPFNFLDGSEFPLFKNIEDGTAIYTFTDQLEIQVARNYENESTQISVYSPDHENTVKIEGYGSLIGKKDEFIFFSGSGVPEAWPLLIYDLSKEKLVLSKYMAKAMIKKKKYTLR
ncbi:hypothetical protein DKG77_11095 [Flagellimonas aquimarina]|uniref:Uncharacterized protein n=1 Tax=Flagellimonas aquimarina TaxID=2201895 RepID=A0A316L3I3_9FLAO|nr:hypothetical protein [Allomuricauda koreensis]PWL38783.1 hypothetical protein DKG77_11095 [Allomuricauda koreensis]